VIRGRKLEFREAQICADVRAIFKGFCGFHDCSQEFLTRSSDGMRHVNHCVLPLSRLHNFIGNLQNGYRC
jgi:hypothetical protein